MSKKEVMEQMQGKLAPIPQELDLAGELTQEDCERGRICIMQASSELVKQDKARQGSYINVSDGTELGYKEEKPLEIIPFSFVKYWVEIDGNTQKYLGRTPALHEKEKPWEEMVGGVLVKRMFTFSYIVLLPSDVAQNQAMPYELAFRSTELATVKKINAYLMRMKRQNLMAWDKTFLLPLKLKTRDKNSWWGSEFVVGRDTTPAEKSAAMEFRKQFLNAQAQFLNDRTPPIGGDF